MSLDHTHDDVRAALAGEALDALSPGERDRLLDHLARCDQCAGELAELREGAALLAYLAPPRALDPTRAAAMRARLVARAAADRAARAGEEGDDRAPLRIVRDASPASAEAQTSEAPTASPPTAAVPLRSGGRAGWLAAAASLVLLCGAATWAWSLRSRLDVLSGRYAALEAEHARSTRAMAERERTIAGLVGPGVRVIDLASTGTAAPSGRMFWDAAAGTWTFVAHNLPAVREGREYELWLITPGRKIPAGTFRPDARGTARLQATYALPADSLRAIAVTEEPAGGVPEPTGAIVIVGAMSE